jgi:hypothetical protein
MPSSDPGGWATAIRCQPRGQFRELATEKPVCPFLTNDCYADEESTAAAIQQLIWEHAAEDAAQRVDLQ